MIKGFHLALIVAFATASLLCVACFVARAETPASAPASVPASAPAAERRVDALLWKVELPVIIRGFGSMAVLNDDLIFFPGRDKIVYAVSRADGQKKWKYDAGYINSPYLQLSGNTLICSTATGYSPITALDAASGKELWQTKDHYFSATVCRTHLVTYQGGDDLERLISLSLKDGAIEWTREVKELAGSDYDYARRSSVRYANGSLLIEMYRGENAESTRWGMIAVNPATGETLWDMTVPDGFSDSSDIVGEQLYAAMLYHKTKTTAVRVCDLKAGRTWTDTPLKIDNAWEVFNGVGIMVVGEILLTGSHAGLAAYDLAGGKLLWRHAPNGDSGKRPDDDGIRMRATYSYASLSNVTVHDGEVIFPVGDGLLALDLKTGKPRWNYVAESFVAGRPIVRDGIVYFKSGGGTISMRGQVIIQGSDTNYLYALDLAKARRLGMSEGKE